MFFMRIPVENSRLKMQAEAQENKIQEKDSEVLRLLNQIATDMIRKSDVDRLIEEAVGNPPYERKVISI